MSFSIGEEVTISEDCKFYSIRREDVDIVGRAPDGMEADWAVRCPDDVVVFVEESELIPEMDIGIDFAKIRECDATIEAKWSYSSPYSNWSGITKKSSS